MRRRIRKNRYQFIKKQFSARMQKKLLGLFLLIIVIFAILVGRIVELNASRGDLYTRIVLNQQAYDSRIIPFRRGNIEDRHGTVLATSERVYNVILDIYVMTHREETIEPTIQMLVDFFELEESDIRRRIEEHPDSVYQVLLRDISHDKYIAYHELIADEEFANVRGIWFEPNFRRFYPYHFLASGVVGFAITAEYEQRFDGQAGIESQFNDILNGTHGREFGFFGPDANIERTINPPQNGHTVVLTLDVVVQSLIEERLQEFNQTHFGGVRANELGAVNTAVLVMNPNTGEILAHAAYPNFDLNNPRDLSGIMSEEAIEQLSDAEQVDALQGLWRNFIVNDTFEPGSTAKPFTMAMALETGALQGDESFYCGGVMRVADHDIHCWNRNGHGMLNLAEAMAFSCNIAHMQIALLLGEDHQERVAEFTRYQAIFGFGKLTGIDLPGEQSAASLVYTQDNMGVADLLTNAFGQNFNVTMIQLASGFSSLINGGYYFQPHIVKQIQDESGRVVQTNDPTLIRKTISRETSDLIKPQLEATMAFGTGHTVQVPGYDIGGKTGTGEMHPRGQGNYLTSIIGYAPHDTPEVVVYVVIDRPNVGDQANSTYVRELTRLIMEDIFPQLNISGTPVTLELSN